MCRLFGISYGETQESVPTEVIAATLFNSLTRGGPHAYGWFMSDGEYVWHEKHYGRADTEEAFDNVMSIKDAPDAPWSDDVKFFVGHTRWATTGLPEHMPNNHPILHKNILGIHNGKVYNSATILKKTGREDDTATVDSEAIFAAVNEWGPVKGLSKLVTDMVAVYTDLRDPSRIFLARSDNRDVTIGITTKGNLIFASEKSALEALYPLVRFVSFVSVGRNRLLRIENGEVSKARTIQIRSSAPVKKKKPTPKPRPVTASALMQEIMAHDSLESRRADRATRRGEMLLGSRHKS